MGGATSAGRGGLDNFGRPLTPPRGVPFNPEDGKSGLIRMCETW